MTQPQHPVSAPSIARAFIARQITPWVWQVLLTLLVANAFWIPLPFIASRDPLNWWIGLAGSSIAFVGTGLALLLLRRRAVYAALLASAVGLLVGSAVALIGWGLTDGAGVLSIVALPIILAALLASPRGLLAVTGLCMLVVALTGFLEGPPYYLAGVASLGPNRTIITVGSFILANGVLAVFVQRFSQSLRDALAVALMRQEELEQHRTHLEQEVGERTAALQSANRELQRLAEELGAHNQHLRASLELARDIQTGLLPSTIPWDRQRLDVHSYSLPAFEVGGDFYTYATLDASRIAVAIGDISGKGVSAALIMSLTLSLLEERLQQTPEPGMLLSTLNRQLARRLQHNRMNAALLCAVVDMEQGTLAVANAGMIPPIILRSRRVSYVDAYGLPIGSLDTHTYAETRSSLCAGDVILLMSDGIVEAHNGDRDMFGFARLEQTLQRLAGAATPEQIANQIIAEVMTFMAGAQQHDDITIVALQVPRTKGTKASG